MHESGYLSPDVFDASSAVVPTDDWPYLYLKDRHIPLNYLVCLVCLALFAVLVIRGAGIKFGRSHFLFFFLGAGFLLIETKAMTELAIFLGSTWVVNVFVISMILGFILLANWVASSKLQPSSQRMYLILALVIVATYFMPLNALLGWKSALRDWVAVGVLCAPLFFSGIIFATELKNQKRPSAALGANLVGALVGGVLEYFSMIFGFKALYLFALALYGCSYLCFLRTEGVRS
jgi:hypothetical protein